MSADVRSPNTLMEADPSLGTELRIEAFAPAPAPMAMPIRALERSWAERLFALPARPALNPANR
ncbi:hypothetical protein [Amorphus coralli]|uniref:hypothetical protein n=1 Tax=Amorphus coralli TaxID=340680 RepID=UPI0012EB48BB|nr:hypothetical protein [Amorphus coralli]